MKITFQIVALQLCIFSAVHVQAQTSERLSVEYAGQFTEMHLGWGYISGVVSTAFEQMYLVTGDSSYYNIIQAVVNKEISEYGDFRSVGLYDSWSADNVRPACQVPTLYRLTGDDRYRMGADTVFLSIQRAPRNSYDAIWHKWYYYNEILLDGIYMETPFYAAYNSAFNRPELQEDVIHQIAEVYTHTWDPDKQLLYHGWYDFENDTTGTYPYWDLNQTGISTVFWGRSIGWYAMALVDVLDFLPAAHPQRDSIIGLFSHLAEGIASYQDPDSLVWWQVVDQPKRDSNWIESSASCMFVYALAKGVRKGYIDSTYLETATTGYQGILDKFLITDARELDIINVCVGTIVGPDYAYYVDREISHGGHADGAFILASIEMEMIDSVYPPGLLGIDSVVEGAINISWNNNQREVLGYVLERKAGDSFIQIADLGVDVTSYSDSLIEPNSEYLYRVCAYTRNDTSRWSNILSVTSANADGLPSPAFLPFPENNAADIKTRQVLKWKKGLLADTHRLYFGTTNPPPFVAEMEEISYKPDNLQKDSIYYWRVDEVNERGMTTGETWRFDMEKSVGTEPGQSGNVLRIYPNPVSDILVIENFEPGFTVAVYDLQGKLLLSHMTRGEHTDIDCRNWGKGIYIVQVRGPGSVSYAKLMKE